MLYLVYIRQAVGEKLQDKIVSSPKQYVLKVDKNL